MIKAPVVAQQPFTMLSNNSCLLYCWMPALNSNTCYSTCYPASPYLIFYYIANIDLFVFMPFVKIGSVKYNFIFNMKVNEYHIKIKKMGRGKHVYFQLAVNIMQLLANIGNLSNHMQCKHSQYPIPISSIH